MLTFSVTASCSGDAERPPGAELRVDTTAGGSVHLQNPAEGLWSRSGAPAWRLEEELRIGQVEGSGPRVFGSVRNVIPDAVGRMWVLDSRALELRVFDATGTFLFGLGGPGDGPGEFAGGNVCAFPGPGGEIWVEDSRHRWHRFDSTGAHLGTHPSGLRNRCFQRRWTSGGSFVTVDSRQDHATRTTTRSYVVHRMDDAGDLTPMDTLPPPELPPSRSVTWQRADGFQWVRTIPFTPLRRREVGPHGDVWIADAGDRYAIRRQTLRGDTVMIIEREYEPVRVPDSIWQQAIEDFPPDEMTALDDWNPRAVPRFYPPIEWFDIATDGTLWVRRRIEGAALAFDVFDPEGKYLGQVDAPEEFDRMTVQSVTSDAMYTVFRDELDVPYVVRLGIRRGER